MASLQYEIGEFLRRNCQLLIQQVINLLHRCPALIVFSLWYCSAATP
jgi:hypothetical protein